MKFALLRLWMTGVAPFIGNASTIMWQRHDPDGSRDTFIVRDGECVIIGVALGGGKTTELG
jgi:hypothetical protein